MTITQVITTLPAAPDPATDTQDQFSTKAAASVLAQKAMVPELNTWAGQVNAITAAAVGDVATAIGAATADTPVGTDEFCWRKTATGLLKKVTFTGALDWFAAKAGSASQAFSVAAATAAAHAVRADGVMGRNKIINGRFQINQRGNVSAATLASGSYGHDRFKAGASGGDYSFTQNAANTTITIAVGKSLIQVIENVNVSDTTFVLSWSGTAQARYAVNSATPAGTYAASPILITGQTVGTVMSVEFNAGTLGNVQLEAGAIATQYEARHYTTEMALCQRYCCLVTVGMQLGYVGFGWYTYSFPTTMRATPSTRISVAGTQGGTCVITTDAGGLNTTSGYFQIQALTGNDSWNGRVIEFTAEL